jgi:hypothetical protein
MTSLMKLRGGPYDNLYTYLHDDASYWLQKSEGIGVIRYNRDISRLSLMHGDMEGHQLLQYEDTYKSVEEARHDETTD